VKGQIGGRVAAPELVSKDSNELKAWFQAIEELEVRMTAVNANKGGAGQIDEVDGKVEDEKKNLKNKMGISISGETLIKFAMSKAISQCKVPDLKIKGAVSVA
jgi:hypothetical protein